MKGQENKGVGEESVEQDKEIDRVSIMSERTEQVKEAVEEGNDEGLSEANKEPRRDETLFEKEENASGTTALMEHCSAQQPQRNESEMVSSHDLSAAHSIVMEDESPSVNNSNNDEEAVPYLIPSLMEQGSVHNEDNVEVVENIAQAQDAVEIEQDVEDQVAVETRENNASDADEATAVFSAYLAPTPEEARQRALANAVVATNVHVVVPRSERQATTQNKWKAPFIALAVVVAVTLAVSLGVTLSGGNNEDSPAAPTQAPTSVWFGQVVELIGAISNTTSLQDPLSPQYQAAQWMAEEDTLLGDLATVDPDRFRQRYILTLFYFATGGPTSWIETSFFLEPDVHECEWRDTELPNTQSWTGYVGAIQCSSDRWIEGIEINQNNLTGTLPDELGSLSSLAALFVFGNKIGGTLPTSLFELSNLEWLILWSNDFTGTIPTEVGQASSLLWLRLRTNSLTGTIPSEIGNISSLDQLDLALNSLTGSIPETVLQLSNITLFEVGVNALTGTLPSSIWSSWPSLRVFGVTRNSLSGTISNNLDSVLRLEQLILQQNLFTGPFPSSIVKLTNVIEFHVDTNAFTGSLPNNWTNLSSTLELLQH